jgi:class 3 adenylate cyclase/WD40 repeat protein/tRNA A-37 threonylcarbamoyl transferase component Bud32
MCGDPARGNTVLTLFRERYEVLATVGSGGEAQIVKALDRQHARFVALKIRPVRDEAAREDLLGEARVLLALPPHPALPLVREDFFDRDDYVVAMDWVEGTDLATLLAENGRPGLAPSSVLAYLAQAAEALTHLHSQSPPVIHGDVKPGNLILTKGGRIKLVDFGLSSAPNVPRVRAGTPGYRAPELAAGGVPSRASDVYALAATAFALLTGSPPAGVLPMWDGFDPAQAEQLEAAIRLGMATDPSRRPKTPGELVERLRAGWSEALPTGVVTFCFSDIEGSTALWDSRPEAMAEALVRHDELIADAVAARGGSLIKSMGEGDSTVSVFDSAPAAVEAALAANRALTTEEWPPGIGIAARWGIHTGEAERRDADYYGPSINLAARVRSAADGGEILLSTVTSELVAAHLPESCSLVDLGSHRLKGVATPERIHALAGPGIRTPLSTAECPYRGLLAFEPDDRAFFFGREEVTAKIIGRLAPGRLLAVVGASGSGKSSVLRAGVVAAVRAGEVDGLRHAWLVTPGAAPALDAEDEPDRLVVVDQFEELFTLCDDADRRRAFIDALLRMRCAVAIGVRADIYGRLSGHSELALAVADNQVLLGPMGAGELERAISEPARLAGLKLEPGLVELILRDVAAEPGALPLLSHALRATWERRDGRTLTVEGYRETGGVASAIGRTADGLVDALPQDQRRLVRSVLVRMTELGEGSEDSRRRVAVGELVPEGAAAGSVEALLRRLAEERLVTLDDGSAEVAHEALIREWPQLRRWLDEDRAGIRAHQQLGDAARLWDVGGREASDLYRGARLAAALELVESRRAQLNATERAFLDAAAEEADRERRAERRTNRRLRGLLAGAAVLLVVALLGGVLAIISRNSAQDAERGAEAQALTADAQRIGALSRAAPTLAQSMLYAAAAVEVEDTVETRGDLLAALQRNWAAVRSLPLSSTSLTGAAVSPDGGLLASTDLAGVVRFINLRTWAQQGAPVRLGRPIDWGTITFSPDGRTLAVATRQEGRAEVHVIDVQARAARRIGSWDGLGPDIDSPTTALAYAPDGRRLAVGLVTLPTWRLYPVAQRLLLLDTRSGRPVWQRQYPHRGEQWEAHLLFLPSGELLTSAQQGETLVWDASAGRILRRYPIGGRFAVSPDRRRIAIARNSHFPGDPSSSLTVLDLRTGAYEDLSPRLNASWIGALVYTRDGNRIVAAATEMTTVWDVAADEIVETYGTKLGPPTAGVVLDQRGLALDSRYDGTMTVWDPEATRRIGRRFYFDSGTRGCFANPCFAMAPRGDVMASSRGDGTVTLVDLRARRRIADLPARDGTSAEAMAFTPDGRRLATGGNAGTVTIRDVRSRAIVRRLSFGGWVYGVAFSPDGRLIAVQHKREEATEATVEVRRLRSDTRVYVKTVAGGGGELAFTRDGRVLVASACCATVAAWKARSGEQQLRVPASDQANTFTVSPDSEVVAVGSTGGRIRLWDLRTGRPRGASTKVAGANINQLAISPDGRLLAVGAFDGTAAVWDLRSRTRIGDSFPVVRGLAPSVAFKPDGRLLVGEHVSAIEWPLDRPTLQRFACRVAGRDMTRAEWEDVLPNQPYRRVCD